MTKLRKFTHMIVKNLIDMAEIARKNAYAPYSSFSVGAAIRASSGEVYTGCNVENSAYPEGTCAEAGAIAAMVVAGEQKIHEITVIADSPYPVAPCGGCRQKISEFSSPDTLITLATTSGIKEVTTIKDLLPGAFDRSFMALK
jgi:cytidine deaminase